MSTNDHGKAKANRSWIYHEHAPHLQELRLCRPLLSRERVGISYKRDKIFSAFLFLRKV